MFGYTNPHEQAPGQVQPQAGFPGLQRPYPQAGFPVPQEAPGGPLAGFEQSYAQVMQGAAPQGIRVESQAEAWAKGAAIGFGAWYVGRRMRARKARVGTYTTPMVRATILWWALFAIVVYLQAVTNSWAVLIGGFVLVSLIATAYLTYASRKVARQGRR